MRNSFWVGRSAKLFLPPVSLTRSNWLDGWLDEKNGDSTDSTDSTSFWPVTRWKEKYLERTRWTRWDSDQKLDENKIWIWLDEFLTKNSVLDDFADFQKIIFSRFIKLWPDFSPRSSHPLNDIIHASYTQSTRFCSNSILDQNCWNYSTTRRNDSTRFCRNSILGQNCRNYSTNFF